VSGGIGGKEEYWHIPAADVAVGRLSLAHHLRKKLAIKSEAKNSL